MKKNKNRSHLRLVRPSHQPKAERKSPFKRAKEWVLGRRGQITKVAKKMSYVGILISLGVLLALTVVYVAIIEQL